MASIAHLNILRVRGLFRNVYRVSSSCEALFDTIYVLRESHIRRPFHDGKAIYRRSRYVEK
jgi:hypothetical protein